MAKNKKKKHIVIWVVLGVVLASLVVAFSIVSTKPRVRMLLSTLNFSERTLNNKHYLLYGIDIMELSRYYANGETVITGHMGVDGIENVKASVYVDVNMRRSFMQKRIAANSKVKLLFLDMGDINIYGEDETVYFDVPMLGDFGYAFPTGINLFMKMPDMTSDLNREWFRDNYRNIINFMSEIGLEETGKVYTNSEGIESEEFIVTIPEGSGKFIWDLLGMEMPDFNVVVSMYLDKHNHLIRSELDMSDVLPGARIVTEGANVRTLYMYYELPENERVETTMERDEKIPTRMNVRSTYYANNGKEYIVETYITWEKLENGFDLRLNDMVAYEGTKQIAKAYFAGNVSRTQDMTDVFNENEEYLYSLETLDWRAIRDDMDSFINDILEKLDISLPSL